jgi:hypothetical protein
MAHIMPFFWTPLTVVVGRTIIYWGLFSLTWKTFICSNTVFPLLLNTTLLVGLDVLIEIIQDFLKCYSRNAIKLAMMRSMLLNKLN